MVGLIRVDYRYLRLVSVPPFIVALVLLVVVLTPPSHQAHQVGGSARWLQIGPLPAVHPAEFAKLALVVLPGPLVRQAGQRRPTGCGAAPSRS